MASGLPDFFTYNLWANQRLLDACAPLSDAQLDATVPGVYGSIREILIHLFDSEECYAGLFTGDTLEQLTTFPGLAELHRRAERSGRALITIAEQEDLNRALHIDGHTDDVPAIIILIQAITHTIDHRSQISTILTRQGIEPPDLDGWSYNDARH